MAFLTDHVHHLRQVLQTLRFESVFVNFKKCAFAQDHVIFWASLSHPKEWLLIWRRSMRLLHGRLLIMSMRFVAFMYLPLFIGDLCEDLVLLWLSLRSVQKKAPSCGLSPPNKPLRRLRNCSPKPRFCSSQTLKHFSKWPVMLPTSVIGEFSSTIYICSSS
jgi:hypothetical protein